MGIPIIVPRGAVAGIHVVLGPQVVAQVLAVFCAEKQFCSLSQHILPGIQIGFQSSLPRWPLQIIAPCIIFRPAHAHQHHHEIQVPLALLNWCCNILQPYVVGALGSTLG